VTFRQYVYDWVFYFSILLIIAILLSATPMQDWGRDLATAAKSTIYGDPLSFATAAKDVVQNGWVIDSSKSTFDLWPPGFVLLEAGLLKLFGSNVPMPALLLVLSAGLFAALMIEMRRLLAASFGQWAWLIPPLMFCFAEARIFILSSVGLLLGEWLAIGSFFLAMLLLLRATLKATILAGILFAISAYTRSQFELFLDVILVVSVGLWGSRYFNKSRNFNGWRVGKLLLIAMVVAQTLMLPWRLYHFQEGKGLRWVTSVDMIIQDGLASDMALQEDNKTFIIIGGGNVACHIAPEHCGEKESRIYLNIFLEHPFAWIKEKVQVLPKYWYTFVNKSTFVLPFYNYPVLNIAQSILLLSLLLSAALLWFVRKSPAANLWTGVGSGLLIAHLVIVLFAHLEVRYFFFIKIYSVFSLILLLGLMVELRLQKENGKSLGVNNSKGEVKK
jgi:hypothetical protein